MSTGTSRFLLLTAPRQLARTEQALPALGPRDVLVHTRVGAISIGSELPHYLATPRQSAPDTYPWMERYTGA